MESNDNRESTANRGRCNRRRQYLINPGFQWKYAIMLALAVFLISALISSVLYALLHHQARLRLMNPEAYTAQVTLVILLFGAAFSMLTAGALAVWCVFMTHRICGPLFVLERNLGELADGRFPKLRSLRRKDEFKDLYATFGRAVESLKVNKQAELATLTQALSIAESAANANDEARKDALSSVATHIKTLRDVATKALGVEAGAVPEAATVRSGSTAKIPVAVM